MSLVTQWSYLGLCALGNSTTKKPVQILTSVTKKIPIKFNEVGEGLSHQWTSKMGKIFYPHLRLKVVRQCQIHKQRKVLYNTTGRDHVCKVLISQLIILVPLIFSLHVVKRQTRTCCNPKRSASKGKWLLVCSLNTGKKTQRQQTHMMTQRHSAPFIQ